MPDRTDVLTAELKEIFQAPELSETPKNFCWFLTTRICFVGVEDAIYCRFAFCVYLLCAAGEFKFIIFLTGIVEHFN